MAISTKQILTPEENREFHRMVGKISGHRPGQWMDIETDVEGGLPYMLHLGNIREVDATEDTPANREYKRRLADPAAFTHIGSFPVDLDE